MSVKHPIDDLFRDKLENNEAEYNEAYWQEARKVLRRNESSLFLRIIRRWWPLLLLLLIAGGTTTWFTLNQNHATSKNETIAENQKTNEVTTASQQHQNAAPAILNADSNSATASATITPATDTVIAPHPAAQSTASNSGATQHKKAGQPNESKTEVPSNTLAATNEMMQHDDGVSNTSQENTGETTSSGNQLGFGRKTTNEFALMNRLPLHSFTLQNLNASHPQRMSLASYKHNWQPVHALEFSLTGGVASAQVPNYASSKLNGEWNANLQYTFNNFLIAGGIGEFFVNEYFNSITDSIIDNSYSYTQFDSTFLYWSYFDSAYNNFDSTWTYDSLAHWQVNSSEVYVTQIDSQQVNKKVSSSGRYMELPLLFAYRFSWLHVRWQLTAGASYAFYSGGLKYALTSDGQLLAYKPEDKLSLIARLYGQYPVTDKIYFQGYAGARYVMGLKAGSPENNFFTYSLGIGLLYRFR